MKYIRMKRNFMKSVNFDMTNLLKNDKIIMGPFIGELGWEILRWSPFVRWFKNKYPNKTIVSATRKDRCDLYPLLDQVYTFDIQGDYNEYRPNMYRMDFFPEEKYNKIIDNLKISFPNYYIYEPPRPSRDRSYFPIENMDFYIPSNRNNSNLIYNILSANKSKIPIIISPRHRIDLIGRGTERIRNWIENNWIELFDILNNYNKFIVFICGNSSSIIKPKASYNSFYILEDLSKKSSDCSLIGLTIEAIRNSRVTIGQQSAIPVLSNYMKTPTIMWGDEKYRHQVLENPFNTTCIFFEEKTSDYKIDPKIIGYEVIKFLESK